MNPESLKWREWDMISGGLEAFINDEEIWLDDDRPSVVKNTQETLDQLQSLLRKVEAIKKTLWASEMGLTR
tara:strand:- start:104 stop:316 length:213 start_codon:yes stop_codon:yes gene_type:complete